MISAMYGCQKQKPELISKGLAVFANQQSGITVVLETAYPSGRERTLWEQLLGSDREKQK